MYAISKLSTLYIKIIWLIILKYIVEEIPDWQYYFSRSPTQWYGLGLKKNHFVHISLLIALLTTIYLYRSAEIYPIYCLLLLFVLFLYKKKWFRKTEKPAKLVYVVWHMFWLCRANRQLKYWTPDSTKQYIWWKNTHSLKAAVNCSLHISSKCIGFSNHLCELEMKTKIKTEIHIKNKS